MTDTHTVVGSPPATAPSMPSTPASPPPTQAEVQVSETPVQTETPLGTQAPPKPPGQESNLSSNVSRRDAIQNAFRRSAEAQAEAAKTASERPKTPQKRGADDADDADAKKQTQSARPEQHREQGRFARDPNKPQPEQTPPNPATSQQQQPQPQQFQPLDKNAPYAKPPQRFSAQAQSDWAGAPESVRGAVYQMGREFQQAYERYRGDHETMETLRPWHDLATKQGTTLEKAFTNYYSMEQKLRQDLIGGLDNIVNNLNLKSNTGQPITLYDVAHHILNMTPEQHRLTAQANQQTAADMRIGQLHQQVANQGQQLSKLIDTIRYNQTRTQIDAFAEKHPRFDELSDLIKQEIDLGFSIDVAYARADKLRPATQAAQTRTTSAQTRRTSISGAPDGGNGRSATTRPSDGQRKNGEDKQPPTRREAIARAMRRVSGGV